MRRDWPPPWPSPHPRYPGCSSVSWLWGLSNQNTKAELPDENLPMRLCNWGQAPLRGALIPGEGAQAVQRAPRETPRRGGWGRGGRQSAARPALQPHLGPPCPRQAPRPSHPPSLPPISPENGMLKTGGLCNLFRKEHPIHHSWAVSQEAFSKHTGFRKSVFRPQLATFFFLTYPCCFNFLHKLFYFRIILDLPALQR